MREHLVIIGNGMATGRLLDELIQRNAQDRYTITVVGEEPYGNYNRIRLSAVLAQELAPAQVVQKDKGWFAQQQIVFYCGVRAEKIDRPQRRVVLSNGESLAYDHLVIATGSRPATIGAANQSLANIFSFRGLQDVENITAAARHARRALVVGGGFLGLEAAYGLAQQGLDVSVVHRGDWLLNRQLDRQAGDFLQQTMAGKNIRCYVANQVSAFIGRQQLAGAELQNAESISCEVAVIATGISPDKVLAQASGLVCDRGICVDERMLSSDERITALGECVEFAGSTFGLVEPIWQMCRVVADRLCGISCHAFVNKPVATKLKISGVNMLSAGQYLTQSDHRELRVVDEKNKCYRKLLLKDDKIVGAVLFGDTDSGAEYYDLMDKKIDVAAALPELIFGRAHCDMDALQNAV